MSSWSSQNNEFVNANFDVVLFATINVIFVFPKFKYLRCFRHEWSSISTDLPSFLKTGRTLQSFRCVRNGGKDGGRGEERVDGGGRSRSVLCVGATKQTDSVFLSFMWAESNSAS